MDDQMDHATKKAPATRAPAARPEPSSTPGTVREDQARQAMDDQMDRAAKAATAAQAAEARRRALAGQAKVRVAAHDPQARTEMAASARASRTAARAKKVDDWMARHPYAAEVLAATGPHPTNPNADTQVGLNGSDPKDYQETWKWGQQENEVINPGGFQGGSPMYEEYAARLYARHNKMFSPGDPITNEEDDIQRSNAPKDVKKLFEDARQARGDAYGKFEWFRDAVDGMFTLDH